jgi:hypothetical protein
MGWRLVRAAEDNAPDSLTWRERYALLVLANAAMDDTRECEPEIEDNPEIIRRLRIGSRSERYAVIQALCDKGALMKKERGRNGVKAVYVVAPFQGLAYLTGRAESSGRRSKGPGSPDASPVDNPVKGPGSPDASPVDNPVKGPGNPDASPRLKGPGLAAEGSGFGGMKGPGNPDASPAGTVFFRGDQEETEETRPTRAHARTREAIREAFPGLNDEEIDETIRVVKARLNPRDIGKYIPRLIQNGDLAKYIPCGLNGRRHSDRCRNRDCANCTASWCEGRCHGRRNAASEAS